MTVFDDLDGDLQDKGQQEFEELINGVSPHEIASMSIEDAFKIGFAKGVEAKD